MRKIIFAAALLAAAVLFQKGAEARILNFDNLIKKPNLAASFNVKKDKILFNHGVNENYPLIYKIEGNGITFRLDNGSGTPRYKTLGTLPITGVTDAQVKSKKTPHGTMILFVD